MPANFHLKPDKTEPVDGLGTGMAGDLSVRLGLVAGFIYLNNHQCVKLKRGILSQISFFSAASQEASIVFSIAMPSRIVKHKTANFSMECSSFLNSKHPPPVRVNLSTSSS